MSPPKKGIRKGRRYTVMQQGQGMSLSVLFSVCVLPFLYLRMFRNVSLLVAEFFLYISICLSQHQKAGLEVCFFFFKEANFVEAPASL